MHSLESLIQDARYALRALRTNRGVATLVVAALALAIGANTAIFTITNALILRSLPVKDPEHLVNVRVGNFMSWGYIEADDSFTYGLWQQLLRHQDVLSDFFAYADWRFDAVLNDETKAVNGAFATAPMFRTLGIQAVVGRVYSETDEENARAVPVTVISYGVWQREFGSDPGAIGRTVVIEGKPFTIIGVLPPRFFGLTVGRMADFYLPVAAEPYVRGSDSAQLDPLRYFLQVYGRLRPGVTTVQANARLGALAVIAMQATVPSGLPEQERPTYLKQTFVLAPGQWGISYVRGYLERPLAVLAGVVALLLLLACFTVANLMLAMATARQREFAVRIALGASRGRIVRQLALESGTLALIGGAAGLLLARVMSDLLVRAYSRNSDPLFLTLAPDWRVFGFALLTAGFSAVLFGLTPALRSARVEPAESLKTGSATVSAGVLRARRYLLAAQLAVTVVLVSGAVLFGETLRHLLTEKSAFNSDRVLIANVDLRRTRIAEDDRLRYYGDLLDRMRAVPSVAAVAASYVAPISGRTWQFDVNAETAAGAKPIHIHYNAVSADFLRLFGTGVLAGRGFTNGDKHGAPLVALVNQTLARAAFGDGQAIGKRMSMLDPKPLTVEIVGVVQDVKYRNLRDAVPPTLYAAFDQFKEPPASISISVRSNSAVEGVLHEVSRILSREYPDLSFQLTPFSAQINDSMVMERAFAVICSMFGVLALGLAAIGLYGVLTYMIERRRPEFGIRMALGASPRDVRRMIYGQSFATCAAGVAIGCLLAVWASRFARAMLFGVSGVEPRMYAVVVGVLAAVAFIATVVPAVRASRTEPMQVLRSE